MPNYIWPALLVASPAFAPGHDVRDLSSETYRNGEPLQTAEGRHLRLSGPERLPEPPASAGALRRAGDGATAFGIEAMKELREPDRARIAHA